MPIYRENITKLVHIRRDTGEMAPQWVVKFYDGSISGDEAEWMRERNRNGFKFKILRNFCHLEIFQKQKKYLTHVR